ncbi:MAG: permease, partial [Planctomycetia bacterium]
MSSDFFIPFNFGDFLLRFMSIVYEALPFIILGSLISGMLEELLPQKFFQRFLPKRRFLAIAGSSLLGVVLPMCECGIVPVMRRLMKKGVPASCAITYMLSAPIINPIVLASTALAFWTPDYTLWGVPGLTMVLLRAGAAFCVAVTVGLLIERMVRKGVGVVRGDAGRDRLVETDESARLRQADVVVTPTLVPLSLPVLNA